MTCREAKDVHESDDADEDLEKVIDKKRGKKLGDPKSKKMDVKVRGRVGGKSSSSAKKSQKTVTEDPEKTDKKDGSEGKDKMFDYSCRFLVGKT